LVVAGGFMDSLKDVAVRKFRKPSIFQWESVL